MGNNNIAAGGGGGGGPGGTRHIRPEPEKNIH